MHIEMGGTTLKSAEGQCSSREELWSSDLSEKDLRLRDHGITGFINHVLQLLPALICDARLWDDMVRLVSSWVLPIATETVKAQLTTTRERLGEHSPRFWPIGWQ